MKRIPAIVLCTSLLFVGQKVYAQLSTDKEQLPSYREVERAYNLYDKSANPASLWFSPLGNILDLQLDFNTLRGDLHDIDESSKVNQFGVGISGQKRFKKVVCSGSINYEDGKEYGQRWNSTRQIANDNPFILGDSIPSDFNLQRFTLSGKVAYQPVQRLILAMQIDYDACSSANQTDPRPKTDGMHFILTPGILFQASDTWRIGLSGSFNLMSEAIEHSIVDTRESYVYFRFKGLGDYSTASSGATSISYPRDYTGTEYTGAFQLSWDGGKGIANLLEANYASNSEKARDGGASFTFLGGDYSRWMVTATDRLRIRSDKKQHTITLSGYHKEVDGIWYEQTAERDTDKNNQIYYEVQLVQPIFHEKTSNIQIAYQYDIMKEHYIPTFTLEAKAYFTHSNSAYDTEYFRKYTLLGGNVQASKLFLLGQNNRNQLITTLGVGGAVPLNSSQTVVERIGELYTAPEFEYITATNVGCYAYVRYLHRFGQLWTGLFVEAAYRCYLGNGKYTSLLAKSDRQCIKGGLQLLF